jgi:hypothetical protein
MAWIAIKLMDVGAMSIWPGAPGLADVDLKRCWLSPLPLCCPAMLRVASTGEIG